MVGAATYATTANDAEKRIHVCIATGHPPLSDIAKLQHLLKIVKRNNLGVTLLYIPFEFKRGRLNTDSKNTVIY